jgi:hypothetical protein
MDYQPGVQTPRLRASDGSSELQKVLVKILNYIYYKINNVIVNTDFSGIPR